MSKADDVVPTDDTAPLVFAVQGDPERLVYRDPASGRVLLEPSRLWYHPALERRSPWNS
ncbi:MAG TPA: hypothetical protein VMN43_11495 [Aestuariivirgaceae bacterium]|nr:hypothetical protein [Aestuariivirgaceae bacterium]